MTRVGTMKLKRLKERQDLEIMSRIEIVKAYRIFLISLVTVGQNVWNESVENTG